MQLDAPSGRWSNVQGMSLTLPVTKESADQFTLIEDTGTVRTTHGTTHLDSFGRPHLVFPAGKDVRYYRWDGKSWQKPVAVGAPGARMHDGDFIIDSPTQVRMLLAETTDAGNEIAWWNTTDGGLTWLKRGVFMTSKERSFNLSAIIRNAHPDAVMLLASRSGDQPHLYRQMHLVGAHGALVRPAAEASYLGNRLEQIKTLPTPNKDKAESKRKKKLGLSDDDL
jgi:hypothetical protein